MPTQLFTVPASGKEAQEHFQTSIVQGVEPAALAGLDESTLNQLEAQATNGRVYAWGALPDGSSDAQWNLLKPGDLCLFYTDGHFPVCGRVSAKLRSLDAAKAIWGTGPDGRAWELMWFFDEILNVGASRDTVRDALGHKPTARFQRFIHVAPAKEQVLRSQYGTIEDFIAHISTAGGGDGAPPSPVPPGTRPFQPDRPPPRSTAGQVPANPEETRANRRKPTPTTTRSWLPSASSSPTATAPRSARCPMRSIWRPRDLTGCA
jgi:hypothetical protein